ncbi:MAG: hypothetical protein IJ205_01115 [Bacteroidales bacterium]|nr:hypothetical protein [Bacteroidales bacterium]
MKYSDIKTMDQLEAAQQKVKSRLESKGVEVKESFYDMRESYSPGNMLMSGLKSVSSYIPVDQLLLTTVRRLKHKILK